MRKPILFIALLILIGAGIFLYSYKGGALLKTVFADKNVSEGVIEYQVTYPKLEPGNPMATFLPDKAYLHFKDDKMVTEMSGLMFRISYISNQSSSSVEQTFALLGQKKVSDISAKELKKLNGSFLTSIEKGTKTKAIAGFACKEALVKLKSGESIQVFYTNDIGINNPNWSNPYTKIDGVLMDFQLESYGLFMHLTANKVLPESVEDSSFDVSKDHTKIPFSELEEMLRTTVAN